MSSPLEVFYVSFKALNEKAASCVAAWDGGSVWDLPIDSVAQAPTIEQMQQYEKAKTAKVRPPLASGKEGEKRGVGLRNNG